MLLHRLVRVNRRLSWLLVFVAFLVLFLGYGLTELDLRSPFVVWGHFLLGGVFGVLFFVHMGISVFLVRYDWVGSVRRVLGGGVGKLTWLRLGQRVSGWFLVLSASLVLLSGLDWFKLGTGWIISFSSHVVWDFLLAAIFMSHTLIGLGFALMRRRVSEPSGFSSARREAIVVLGGMVLSLISFMYLDRIPRFAEVADRVRVGLPPGQYDVSTLRVLHIGQVPEFDEDWTLEVSGLVERPMSLDFSGVTSLPKSFRESPFHCVTGWSKFGNQWEGVRLRTLMEVVRPLQRARFAVFECDDGYSTSLPVEELVVDGVMLAWRLDGFELPPVHGGPLRLVVPHKYGYKSAKWVRRVEFVDENSLGYWERRGYSDTADPFTEDRHTGRRARREDDGVAN
jgi:DMSO/TMAO reductase YedYZ molybdopterin-dependent catalytic subunit